MAASRALSSDYSISSMNRTPATKPRVSRNPHTEGYDDDGLVITMTLSKFFRALRDYSGFLNCGSRAYISLTNDEGDEVFQFDLVEKFNPNQLGDYRKICSFGYSTPKKNMLAVIDIISDSDEPILMKSKSNRVYGVLYPSVTLCPSEPK